jgi:hypothetical protein
MMEVLADPYYKDPKLFTTTIYDETGKLISEPDQEKLTEEEYFAQFISPEEARELARKLKLADIRDKESPLTEREDREQLNSSLSPADRRGRLDDGESEWTSQYDWKTRRPSTD